MRARGRGSARSCAAWVALAGLPTLAAAEVVDVDWGSAGRFERSVVVPAGKFVEVCGKLAAGVRVRWAFAGDRPTSFNIHYHVGKDVVYPVKREAIARTSGEWVAPVDQDYCWMWTNSSAAAAKLDLRLDR